MGMCVGGELGRDAADAAMAFEGSVVATVTWWCAEVAPETAQVREAAFLRTETIECTEAANTACAVHGVVVASHSRAQHFFAI